MCIFVNIVMKKKKQLNLNKINIIVLAIEKDVLDVIKFLKN